MIWKCWHLRGFVHFWNCYLLQDLGPHTSGSLAPGFHLEKKRQYNKWQVSCLYGHQVFWRANISNSSWSERLPFDSCHFRTTEWNCLFCEFLWCQSFVSVQVTRNFDNSIRQGTCYTDFSCVNKRVYCVWLDLLLHSAWLQLLCVCTTELQTEKGSKLSFTAQVTLSELRCKLEKEHVHVKRSIWLSIISS